MNLLRLTVLVISIVATTKASADDIQIYGNVHSTNSVVFCIDLSYASSWQAFNIIAKQQAIEAIQQLVTADFGVVVMGGPTPREFSATLLEPTQANKAAAILWIEAQLPFGQSCLVAAVNRSLEIIGDNTTDPLVLASVGSGTLCHTIGTPQLNNPNCTYVWVDTYFSSTNTLQVASSLIFLSRLCDHEYRRGDSNSDGVVNFLDAVNLLDFLFLLNTRENPCPPSRDVDGNLVIELDDAIHLLSYLFAEGLPPVSPGPANCGLARGGLPGSLNCNQYMICP